MTPRSMNRGAVSAPRLARPLALILAGALVAASAAVAQDAPPLELRGMGSFHHGGRIVEVAGKPTREVAIPGGAAQKTDPNGAFIVEQVYTQYFLPKTRRGKLPLLMWHGGGLTGATYETTPDGREGWLNLFVRKGWDVYVSDAVERGRSGFAPPEVFAGEPVFATHGFAWEAYRVGPKGSWNADPAKRRAFEGTQFPVAAYDSLVRQIVPRWTTTDPAIDAAYIQLVDRVCPCALLVHSQSGAIGYRVAQARPDKIRAFIDVEGTLRGDDASVVRVKSVPILSLHGDFLEGSEQFSTQLKYNLEKAERAKAAGGSIEVVKLADIGMKGNSHFMMMEKNNAAIADYIETWLKSKGLVE